jgi:hypothetical protein
MAYAAMLLQCYPNYKTAHRRFQAWCRSEVVRGVLADSSAGSISACPVIGPSVRNEMSYCIKPDTASLASGVMSIACLSFAERPGTAINIVEVA